MRLSRQGGIDNTPLKSSFGRIKSELVHLVCYPAREAARRPNSGIWFAMLAIRLAKIVSVAAIALYMALVVFNNVTDYWTKFAYVADVHY